MDHQELEGKTLAFLIFAEREEQTPFLIQHDLNPIQRALPEVMSS